MHRQSSRTTYNMDTIDCNVNANDLDFEDERINHSTEQKRSSNDSRRIHSSKRSNGTSNRHSPPLVTHKRSSSPISTSLISSHSQHHYYISQKPQPVSRSPSPPPSSSSTSRHYRSRRPPPVSTGRPRSRSHSRSRSSHDRHQSSTNRSYPTTSKKRSNEVDEITSTSSTKKPTISIKMDKNQNTTDLGIISEDDISTKVPDRQTKKSTVDELPSISSVTSIQSTPSIPILQPTLDKSFLNTSDNIQECELSLFAKSNLSLPNTSLIQPTSSVPNYDLLQTIDLMSKYKTMHAIPSHNPQIEACSHEIFQLILKQIQLHKKVFECREREMNLYERELSKREKHFDEKSHVPIIVQPETIVQSTMIEEKPQQEQKITSEQNTNNVLVSESVSQSIPITVDSSQKPSSSRRLNARSRFSQLPVEKSTLDSQNHPINDLYAGVDEDKPSTSSINTANTLKNTILSPILAPSDSIKPAIDHELKVTSSNSCRTVEIHSDTIHQTVTDKEPPQDLRITLRNNRSKQQNSDEDKDLLDELVNISQEPITMFKPTLIKTISNTDNKQQSHDYQQQRSITSTSIDEIINKRDHRQQHNPREHASSSSSSSITLNDRSHSQKSTKYESNHKRRVNDDLRSRIDEHKYQKPTRSPHRNNR
ncbi:hypothetical protein I4U23_028145 [Adineta vaga]|nr:hypothetical protein I4U23_028145 [Adineta vaga]